MVQPLSEKAKGKQRADVIQEDVPDRDGPTPPRSLMVRFTEGFEDLVLHVTEHDLARDVKTKVHPLSSCSSILSVHAILLCRWTQIREARPQLQRRRLRLIHAGRLLTDETQLASWLGTLEERQLRAATKGKDETDPLALLIPPGPSVPGSVPWLHCSVGAPLSDGEEDGDAQAQVRWRYSPSWHTYDLSSDPTTNHIAVAPESRRRRLSLYAALTALRRQASPKTTSSTFEDSSTRARPQTTSPPPSFRRKRNVRSLVFFFLFIHIHSMLLFPAPPPCPRVFLTILFRLW